MKRRDRRTTIDQRKKEVRALQNKLRAMNIQIRNLGYTNLDKPLRNGWYRKFSLRSDISRHKQVKVYQEILDAVVVPTWGREKKYADKVWESRNKRWSNSYQRPGIRYLNEKEYEKLTSKAKKHFMKIKRKKYNRYQTNYICMLPKYYFQLSYHRAYITRYKIISPELESRIQEITELLNRSEYFKYSIYNYSYFYDKNNHKRRRNKTKMALNKINITNFEDVKTHIT